MNRLLAALTLVATFAATASAASLSVTEFGSGESKAYAIYLDGEADNNQFNVVSFLATPNAGATFANTGTGTPIPRPPGQAGTYRNRLLDADPSEYPGGQGWSVLGAVTTATKLAFDGSPLGQTITTAGEPSGRLFLANINMPTGSFTTTVKLFGAGEQKGPTLTMVFPVPEPATFAMAGLGIVGIVACCRRKAES